MGIYQGVFEIRMITICVALDVVLESGVKSRVEYKHISDEKCCHQGHHSDQFNRT